MTDKTFRFGVVATPFGGADRWRATATRAAELGYQILLMPDVVHILAPGPSLAVAASVADIRVGTWVYAVPLRAPGILAWEAHSLSVLTDGRFEMGIGTGRPGVEAEAARLGLPSGSPAERLAQVAAAIDALRELDGPELHTPVLMAVGGPKARALAAAKADVVTLATAPLTPRDEVASMADDLWQKAGERAGDIELVMNLVAVGDDLPPHLEQMTGADAASLIAADSLSLLPGDTSAMVDELQRRRDRFGVTYIAVNAEFMDTLAPAVEALTGR